MTDRLAELKYLPRKVVTGVQSWILWNRQGRPTDGPVVIRPGRLSIAADGKKSINFWHWDPRYQTKLVTYDELWDFLAARYAVERES